MLLPLKTPEEIPQTEQKLVVVDPAPSEAVEPLAEAVDEDATSMETPVVPRRIASLR
jgi:hypothetical protein